MLVLASASPRRRELLALAGYTFEVESSDIPEVRAPGEDPFRFALRLAREKAGFVHEKRSSAHDFTPKTSNGDAELLVLGADTVVVIEGEVLGKPASAEDAHRMLRLLSGRTHQVITGVCLQSAEHVETAAEVTFVTMQTHIGAGDRRLCRDRGAARQGGRVCHSGRGRTLDSTYPRLLLQRGRAAAGAGQQHD